MRKISFIASLVLLSACVSNLKTFETNLERETYYKSGSSALRPFSTNLVDTIYLADVQICSYVREARWHKGIQFKSLDLDTLVFMDHLINAADSLIFRNASLSLNTQTLNYNVFNACDYKQADMKWTDYLTHVLSATTSMPEGSLGMKLVGRIVTYSSPQLADTFSPHIMTSSGNTEYYVSTRWCAIIYEGSKEVYRGTSLFKDFLIYPDSKDFNYNLTRQNIDSLLSLSMREYFESIK